MTLSITVKMSHPA